MSGKETQKVPYNAVGPVLSFRHELPSEKEACMHLIRPRHRVSHNSCEPVTNVFPTIQYQREKMKEYNVGYLQFGFLSLLTRCFSVQKPDLANRHLSFK